MPGMDPAEDRGTQQRRAAAALETDLSRWREQLARSIARNNLDLRSGEIATAVNRILFSLLLVRYAEDRGLVPGGTLAGISGAGSPAVVRFLIRASRGLYDSDTMAAVGGDSADPVLDDRVLRTILAAALPGRHYDLGELPVEAVSGVLQKYLQKSIRRSAAHQAVIVDSGDAPALPGGKAESLLPVLQYLVRAALADAREGRRRREPVPLRVLDPACGAGTLLLLVLRDLMDHCPTGPPTADEQREILLDSVHGLDADPHAVAAARLLLLFMLAEQRRPGTCEEFTAWANGIFHSLRFTIRCGDALIGPEIARGEPWVFCPPRKRAALCPFALEEGFPEIAAAGGFDVIVSAPPETAPGTEEWIRDYLQRQYRSYDPRLGRPAFLLERSLQFTAPGGTIAFLTGCRWLRGPAGTMLRELVRARQINGIVEIPGDPDGICLLRLQARPPKKPATVTIAGPGFLSDPGAYVAAHGFPVDPARLDAGGWQFRDSRVEQILRKVYRAGTPLDDIVLGQVYPGVQVDDPLYISSETAREWRARDRAVRPLLHPVIRGTDIRRFYAQTAGSLLLIPPGWTEQQGGAADPWRWLKLRHPLIARHLRSHGSRTGEQNRPGSPWWETGPGMWWEEQRGRILFPARFRTPAFLYDPGPAIADDHTMAIPAAGPFLSGILNSRLMAFVFGHMIRKAAPARDCFSWEDIRSLPVYVADFDRPEDQDRHARLERLVLRRMALERSCRSAAPEQRENLEQKIRNADRQTDALVYEFYGLTPEEISMVEVRSA